MPRLTALTLFAALALPLTGLAQAAELLDRVVAVANEDIVTANELSQRTEEIRQRYQGNPQVLPPDAQLQRQVLDSLILERLQLQLAGKMNLNITDSQVNDAINTMARQRNMTLDNFVAAVEASGESYDEVRRQVRRELTMNQVRRRYVGSEINVTDGEISRYLDTLAGQSMQDVKFELLYRRYELSERADAEAQLAELEVGAQLSANSGARNLGLRPVNELPSVFRTVVPVLALNEAVLIENGGALHLAQLIDKTDRQAVQVEQYQVRHILVQPNALLNADQAQALLESLRQRIANGESMASLADQFTDDLGTKGKGGALGWRQPEEFVPAFASQVRQMPLNEVSPVFESNFGYHILRVEDQRTTDVSLDVLRQQVRDSLMQRKYEEALQRWLVELRAQSFVEVRL
ncbi:peptidylprolyl isomerase [Saccharospirillum mangrovi]|uniref:peptidylprolyl isomerase n=1 Tax=Saccharospirillum mangrovi TaxID=2161747 RepID=UPI0013B47216|nr:peptidylprolyl isomerase [Saccharospirillum mangrovi]